MTRPSPMASQHPASSISAAPRGTTTLPAGAWVSPDPTCTVCPGAMDGKTLLWGRGGTGNDDDDDDDDGSTEKMRSAERGSSVGGPRGALRSEGGGLSEGRPSYVPCSNAVIRSVTSRRGVEACGNAAFVPSPSPPSMSPPILLPTLLPTLLPARLPVNSASSSFTTPPA